MSTDPVKPQEMRIIQIADIEVKDRFRKDFGDLNELALSINNHGQLQPIVVIPIEGGKYKLVAGERRLRASQKLNRVDIKAIFWADVSEVEKIELELEENLHRKPFTWQEEVDIKEKIHELKIKQAAGTKQAWEQKDWTIRDTADFLGISKTVVSDDLILAKGIREHPEIAKAPNKATAYKELKRIQSEAVTKELAKRQRDKGLDQDVSARVHCGDACAVLQKIPEGSISLVLIDPPYGIDVEMSRVGGGSGYTMFDDDKANTLDLLDLMIPQLYRVMAPNSSMYMFFHITLYPALAGMLLKAGFDIDPVPMIWHKSMVINVAPDMYPGRSYETFFYVRKGERAFVKTGQSNVLKHDSVSGKEKIHPTEKPLSLLRELIQRSSLEGETVLDACAGSGSTLVAARQTGRQFIGIEKNPHYHQLILQRLSDTKDPEPASEPVAEQTAEELLASVGV